MVFVQFLNIKQTPFVNSLTSSTDFYSLWRGCDKHTSFACSTFPNDTHLYILNHIGAISIETHPLSEHCSHSLMMSFCHTSTKPYRDSSYSLYRCVPTAYFRRRSVAFWIVADLLVGQYSAGINFVNHLKRWRPDFNPVGISRTRC